MVDFKTSLLNTNTPIQHALDMKRERLRNKLTNRFRRRRTTNLVSGAEVACVDVVMR